MIGGQSRVRQHRILQSSIFLGKKMAYELQIRLNKRPYERV